LAPPRKRPLGLALALVGLFLLAVGATPAAANTFSPETPHSPGASEMNTLYWISLVAILLVIVAVNAALLYAVRRYRTRRGAEPRQVRSGRGIQLRAGAALALFALVLFVLGIVFTNRAREVPSTGPNGLQASSTLLAQTSPSGGLPSSPSSPGSSGSSGEPLKITATGQQWLWRYLYPNQAFSYYRLVVPVDTTVQLNLVSTDVIHTWWVPALSGKADAVPGKTNTIYFRADDEGTYTGNSATFSGSGYAPMRIEVDAVSPQDYQTFIEQQKRDIQSAQSNVISELKNGGPPQ
jgi:cytochrome c oxidase subunit II